MINKKINKLHKYDIHKIIKLFIILLIALNILAFSNLLIRNRNNETSFNIFKKEDFVNNKTKTRKINGNPIISIIFDIENLQLNDESIYNLIYILLNQTFKNIEIFILSKSPETFYNKLVSKFQFMSKEVRIYILKYNHWIHNIFDIINQIEGKYLFNF